MGKSGSRSTTLRQPPEEVWRTLADTSRYPSWNSQFVSVDVLTPVMWRAKLLNQDAAVVFQTVESVRPRRLAYRIINSQDVGFGGSIVFDISPAPEGSRVLMINNSEVYNPFQRFLRHVVLRPESFSTATLVALRSHFAGQRPSN